MESKPFKVIIAGGSIAGLSLALMLEKNGIDFVVLEGYPSIAPQVGASIGMLPNGLRILDQLGCCDDVIKRADIHVDKLSFHDSCGQFSGVLTILVNRWRKSEFSYKICLFSFIGYFLHELRPFFFFFCRSHSYPLLFLERRALIQTLYDHIEDKPKILTSEKVVTIKNSPLDVTVTTNTGKSFSGDMLAGADGINSTIRQKMWEESQLVDPTWIDPSEINCMCSSEFVFAMG